MAVLKTKEEIAVMTEAGRRLAEVLEILGGEVQPGVATDALDRRGRELIRLRGAVSAFLHYVSSASRKPYPAAICVSVNDTVVHGVPSPRIVAEGDIVKLDVGLRYRGFYVDAAITVGVGKISDGAQTLIRVTKEALAAGVREARAGNTLGDIGHAIQSTAERRRFSIVETLTGHGIGRKLHEEPTVPNRGRASEGGKLEVGMVLAIEPMVALGSGKVKQLKDDSFVTADGSLAAHFEHTVAITKKGPMVLTEL